MTNFEMLCENYGVLAIRSERTCHDQDGVFCRDGLEFIKDHMSERVTELFVLKPSTRMNRFRGIDDEMVVDKSSLDIREARL